MVFGGDPVRLGMQIAFGRVRRKTAPTENGNRRASVVSDPFARVRDPFFLSRQLNEILKHNYS